MASEAKPRASAMCKISSSPYSSFGFLHNALLPFHIRPLLPHRRRHKIHRHHHRPPLFRSLPEFAASSIWTSTCTTATAWNPPSTPRRTPSPYHFIFTPPSSSPQRDPSPRPAQQRPPRPPTTPSISRFTRAFHRRRFSDCSTAVCNPCLRRLRPMRWCCSVDAMGWRVILARSGISI